MCLYTSQRPSQDISHALSIAETLGVLCKDDRARAEVTKQEQMRVVVPALVELARHCPPTDMEAVLNTLALLAQNQPQVRLRVLACKCSPANACLQMLACKCSTVWHLHPPFPPRRSC